MKKRIFSVLLCLCMVLALFPATAFAEEPEPPETYTVTYDPGENGVGDQVVKLKTQGEDLILEGETFTREGYKQIGWSIEENYDSWNYYYLGEKYTTDEDVTLYPVWDKIITLTVPYTTTVTQGGNVAPGETTFTLEVVDCWGTKIEPDGVTFSGSVTTNGVGDYKEGL